MFETKNEKLRDEYGRASITVNDKIQELDNYLKECEGYLNELSNFTYRDSYGTQMHGDALNIYYDKSTRIYTEINEEIKSVYRLRDKMVENAGELRDVWRKYCDLVERDKYKNNNDFFGW